MKGHEYAREVLKAHLEAWVPARLETIRAARDADFPPDPKAYLLSDVLPDDTAGYPCVLVQSTSMPDWQRTTGGAPGEEFIVDYDVRIVVAVGYSQIGKSAGENASIGRDRLLLAIREALLWRSTLAADAVLISAGLTEQTGAAAQDLQARPIAMGQIDTRVRVVETLTDPLVVADEYQITTGILV